MRTVVFNPVKVKGKTVEQAIAELQSEFNRRMELLNNLVRDVQRLDAKTVQSVATQVINIINSGSQPIVLTDEIQGVTQTVTAGGNQRVQFKTPFKGTNYSPLSFLTLADNSLGFASPLINASDTVNGDTRQLSGLYVYCDTVGILTTVAVRNS